MRNSGTHPSLRRVLISINFGGPYLPGILISNHDCHYYCYAYLFCKNTMPGTVYAYYAMLGGQCAGSSCSRTSHINAGHLTHVFKY